MLVWLLMLCLCNNSQSGLRGEDSDWCHCEWMVVCLCDGLDNGPWWMTSVIHGFPLFFSYDQKPSRCKLDVIFLLLLLLNVIIVGTVENSLKWSENDYYLTPIIRLPSSNWQWQEEEVNWKSLSSISAGFISSVQLNRLRVQVENRD